VPPKLATIDHADKRLIDPKRTRYFSLWFSGSQHRTYAEYIFLSQFRECPTATKGQSALGDTVLNVVLVCPRKEVLGIYARGVIAFMAYLAFRGKFAEKLLVNVAMDKVLFPVDLNPCITATITRM
jgi:hypothetical protein